MSLNLYLQAGTTPALAPLPGNAQALATFIAQYVLIAGGANFDGINYGSTTPSPDDRDKPWWKTDASGNPLGMYNWNGSAWVTVAQVANNGPTANRPINPATYTLYYDTTIGRQLIFIGGWTTQDGCKGEVREVKAATIDIALSLNPGWAQDSDSNGMVIVGAGANSGAGLTTRAYGATFGQEAVTLAINQIPSHTHTTQGQFGSGGEGGGDNPLYYDDAQAPLALQVWPPTGATGGGESHDNCMPAVAYWRIVKL